ncbi:MAG: RNA-binding protein [Gammaproteobacteria bacterium]|nr:RNA-binding protein [Gammaproteobacteria bacterium]MBU1654011.1 RNA-binding protein [Gammaproteobacteria bacterium]MBU1960730.1 RNA-binding protein [Gammaproteobacteria bacterium]
MELFFRNIPARSTHRELFLHTLEGARHWWPFAPEPEITHCEILDIEDEETGNVEHHGLVSIRDPRAAERAIRRLNGRVFNGQAVEVREFTHRSPGDHRIAEENLGFAHPRERRRTQLRVIRRGEARAVEEHKDSMHQNL